MMSGQENCSKRSRNGWRGSLLMHQRSALMEGIRQHCAKAGLVYFKDTGTLHKSCAVSSCSRGDCNIFSLEAIPTSLMPHIDHPDDASVVELSWNKQLTIEVRNQNVVQIKGLQNKSATPEQSHILGRWIGTKGLITGRMW